MLAGFLATACQATVGVGVDAGGNGAGTVQATVTLDQDAASRLAQLGGARVDGLRKAGWTVEGPRPGPDGETVYRATKRYSRPAQATAVVGELSGTNGPFVGFRITQRRSLFETVTTFHGTVDLQRGVDSVSDPTIAAGAVADLGVDVSSLRQQLTADLSRVLRIEVSARLPGSLTGSDSPAPVSNGAVWQPRFGELAQLSASSREWNVARIVLAAALALAVLAAATIASLRLVPSRSLGRWHGRSRSRSR